MAEIVQSLFGVTPDAYQQAQSQRGDAMALRYAQLDPFQQANYAIGRGAYGLAGAAGGLLGGQDPELQRITARQQIASQINPSDPASIQQGIMALQQAGDTQGAMMLQSEFQKMQESRALIGQREAAATESLSTTAKNAAEVSDMAAQQKAFAALMGGQVPATPATIAAAAPTPAMIDQATGAMTYAIPPQTSMSATALPPVTEPALPTVAAQPNIKQQISELEKLRSQLLSLPKVPAAKAQADMLGDQIKELREQGKPTDLSRLEDEIVRLRQEGISENDPRIQNRLSKIEKLSGAAERFGPDYETTAKAKFGKSYRSLSQSEAATVNELVNEQQTKRTPKTVITNVMPGQPIAPKDWMDFTQKVLSNDPVMQRTSTILSDAPSAIEIIRSSTTNDISAASLPGALARLTGEGKNMSNQDVQRFARTGGLDDRLAQDVVKFFSGTTTNVKKDQAEKFATALYRGALIERRKKLVNESEQYGYLDSPNYKSALRQIDDQLSRFQLKTKGGGNTPAAGGLDAEKEARYQAYKRAQEGK